MSVKDHYDNHLGNFYSWSTGDFDTIKNQFKSFCIANCVIPDTTREAVDLGAGHGIQSIALAELGFTVQAIDNNDQLLNELRSRKGRLPIEIRKDDIRNIDRFIHLKPELIVCCGDTIAHLESFDEIRKLIFNVQSLLLPGGQMILSFRDYSLALENTGRFIPVKNDENKILTCFLEYFEDKVRVTDLFYEKQGDRWIQKVSSYFKTRISVQFIKECLRESGMENKAEIEEKGMITLLSVKK